MSDWWSSLGISASGLTAQRLRLNVIANNIANAQTTRTPQGGPYRREEVVLAPASGQQTAFQNALAQAHGLGTTAGGGQLGVRVVGIAQDKSPFKLVYDPSNPDAVNGYVQMPNVNIATEMVDMVSASRAYEANVTAFDAGKQMAMDALSLGK
jgi:flagellar basal-body rod protein FlgC